MFNGQRMKIRRMKMGLSADELAKIIGKSRSQVYRYESGNTTGITAEMVTVLARALNCSEEYLLGAETKEAPNVLREDIIYANRLANLPERQKKLVLELIDTFLSSSQRS